MGRVLVSPLSWGLGHATRDIPVIRELLRRGHEVVVAATGNALAALRREFPEVAWIDAPDYPAPYSAGDTMLPQVLRDAPAMVRALGAERACAERLVSRQEFDLIISDNRLGMYSASVPSLFITHQLRYHFPALLWPVELGALPFNRLVHRKFDRVVVPDNPPGGPALAGKLSRPLLSASYRHIFYAGILATAKKLAVPEDLDYLFVISGPEPQRTVFERAVLPQLKDVPGSRVVLLGSPDAGAAAADPGVSVFSYVDTEEKIALFNRAKCIVCRSGYTTMMELAEMGKRRALLVPTPGQTEQEYLSEYYRDRGWFFSQEQGRLSLARDIAAAEGYRGFPAMPGTEGNVRRLYEEVLAGYVE